MMAQREKQTGVVRENTDQAPEIESQNTQITTTADQALGQDGPQATTTDTQPQPTLGADIDLSTGVKVGALAIGAGIIISQL